MRKQEVKDQIVNIIRAASPHSIVADEIYNRLTQQVDPGRTQETIRGIITELVNNDDNLIGSSSNGYFWIDSEAKLNKAQTYLTNRIAPLQRRSDNLHRLWNESQQT